MKRVHGQIGLSQVKSFSKHRCEPVAMGFSLETNPDTYAWNNRQREWFSLFQYTLNGEGSFRRKALACPVKPGQGFLVNCPSETSYHLPPGRTWEFIYILFVGDMARHHVEAITRKHGHILPMPASAPPVELLLKLYDDASAGRIYDKYGLSELLYRFLMELYRQLETREAVPAGIQRTIWRMEQEYRDPLLSLGRLAGESGFSPFYYSRLFKKHAGISPYAYLQQVRMDHAMDLLISTDVSVKEISRMTGFNDYSYFCRAFRHHHGKTPGRSRNKP